MPHYHSLGKIPAKRHTQFKKADGSLFSEQHLGTIGFNGMYSNAYHLDPPTTVKKSFNNILLHLKLNGKITYNLISFLATILLHIKIIWTLEWSY